MPTTRSRTTHSRSSVLERDRGLEVLELGIAQGLPGDGRSERERAEIGAGQPRRGAPAADPPSLPAELVDEAVDRAVNRATVNPALGLPSGRGLSNEMLDELLAGASTEEEIVGPGGVLAQLTKRLVERALEVELTDHLGYEPHAEPPGGVGNIRNGSTGKTLITENGPVDIRSPRDRDGSFDPKLVRKRQRRFEGFDDKILALYSRGRPGRGGEVRPHGGYTV